MLIKKYSWALETQNMENMNKTRTFYSQEAYIQTVGGTGTNTKYLMP